MNVSNDEFNYAYQREFSKIMDEEYTKIVEEPIRNSNFLQYYIWFSINYLNFSWNKKEIKRLSEVPAIERVSLLLKEQLQELSF